MAKLTLLQTRRSAEKTNKKALHRAAGSEGEAAAKLLEANGYPPKRKANGQVEFACPFHEEPGEPRKKGTNFYVDSVTSKFYCHSAKCGQRGNLQTLERLFGIDADDTSPEYMTKEKRLKVYEASLGTTLREPFYDHGLTDETIERFRLGWDNENQHYVIPYLEGRRPVAFRFYHPDGTGPNGSKYWWETGSTARLYNVNDAVGDEDGRVLIAEGEQKAMLLCQLGYAAVAVPGAGTFKTEWYSHFNSAKKVYIAFDNDSPEHHIRENCRLCAPADCHGHNPGQEAALKVTDAFDWRASNVVFPLPEGERKTDVNEYFIRDGNSNVDFQELAFGIKKDRYRVSTLADLLDAPPDEAEFLIEDGILTKGGRLLVTGAPKAGKAQRLSTPVLTPQGWSTMGALRPGDEVMAPDGLPVEVTHIHPQGVMDIYRVTLSDGTWTECTENHLWTIQTHDDRNRGKSRTVETSTIMAWLDEGKTRHTYLPMTDPVEFDPVGPLPLDPYALGLLLGDGSFRMSTPSFSKPDVELHEALAKAFPDLHLTPSAGGAVYLSSDAGRGVNPLTETLRRLGLWGCTSPEKFVPDVFLRASILDRLALLQGLMDTDGWVEENDLGNTSAHFSTSSPRLADAVRELVQSLGGVVRMKVKDEPQYQGGIGKSAYILRVTLPQEFQPFRLERKLYHWESGRTSTNRPPVRRIVSVEHVGSDEAVCITVNHSNGLYLTNDYIVTHNSIYIQNMALSLAAGIPFLGMFKVSKPTRVLLLDRELSKRALFDRLGQLMEYRPGYRAAAENLSIDHDISVKLDAKGALDVLVELVTSNGSEVVFFDTAYKFFGSDMESASSLSKAFSTLDGLIQKTGVSVVLTHHHRKGGKQRDGKDEGAHPDQVAGSFLWTGWPNGTVLLNFANKRVDDPFTTISHFTAFRDAAPPEPVQLNRGRESVAYTSIRKYLPEETSSFGGDEPIAPSTELIQNLLMSMCPIDEEAFLHMAATKLGVRAETIRPYFVDAVSSPHFDKGAGRNPTIKFVRPHVPEETWEDEHLNFDA